MPTRPKLFVVVSLSLIAVAVSFPIQVMWIYGHGFSEIGSILAKLTFLNLLTMGATVATALLILNASQLLKFAVPATVFFVAINNWFVGLVQTDYSALQAVMATIGFLLLQSPLLLPESRHLLTHPETRWWLRADRKKVKVSAFLGPFNGLPFRAATFDLSETGAFIIPTEQDLAFWNNIVLSQTRINDRLSVCLTLPNLSQVRCGARVVRLDDSRGSYPDGIGIQFEDFPTPTKRTLKRYLSKINAPRELTV